MMIHFKNCLVTEKNKSKQTSEKWISTKKPSAKPKKKANENIGKIEIV